MPVQPPLDTTAKLREWINLWHRNDATPSFQGLRMNTTLLSLTDYMDSIIVGAGGEPTIAAGSVGQFFSWDKTWRIVDKTTVGLGNVVNVNQTVATNLTSGSIPAGRYGALTIPISAINATGTADSSTVLFGDGTWGAVNVTDGDKGDITVLGTSWTINDDAITINHLPEIPANRLIGRISGGVGDMEILTGSQATTLLDVFSSTIAGIVPFSGGGTVNFLRADGTWQPPGTGATLADADYGDVTVSSGGSVITIDALAVTNGKINDVAFSKVTGTISGAQVAGTTTNGYVATLVAGVPTWQPSAGSGALTDGDYGDIVLTGSGTVWTIENLAVTLPKMQSISTATILGRATAGSGIIEVLSGTQATELLNVFTPTLKGLVPFPTTVTGKVLSDAGTWVTPATGTNTGDVTLAGETYLSIAAQVLTANAVNLSGTHVTGTLNAARVAGTATDTFVATLVAGIPTWQPPAAGTGTSVTEKKNYYRGERVKNKAINTGTGAITTSAGTDISDYLPIAPSESVTIRATWLGDPSDNSTSLPDITIYGWTYDEDFIAISQIRSSAIIGTQLNTYTFTTPSNAAYLIVYVRYASEDMFDIMRIESTSTITYTSPITPEAYSGTTSAKIQQALDFAQFTSSPVVLTGYYELDARLIMNSGNTLVLYNAHIKLGVGTQDNFIRNEAVRDPATRILTRGNRNINIIGVGNALFEGANEEWGSDDPFGDGTLRWKSHGIHFSNVNGFNITGVTFKATNANPLDLEQCRYGAVTNIAFDMGLEHPNQGGVEIIRGSHHILVENIRGTCQDDIVAMNNILGNEELHILGTTVYDQDRTDLDMFAITVKNIVRDGGVLFTSTPVPLYGNAIRMLTSDALKLHDVTIDGINGYANIFIQSPFGGYELVDEAVLGDVYNISISNTEDAPIYIFSPVQDSTFWNVARYDVSGLYQTTIPPDTSLRITRKYYDDTIEYNSEVGVDSWISLSSGGSSQWNNVPGGIDYTAGIAGIQTAPVTGYSLSLGDGTASSGKLHMNYDPTIGANSAIVYSSAGTPRWSFGGSDDGAFGGTNNTAGGRNFYIYDGAGGYRLGLNASGDLFVGASPSVYGMKITQAGALSLNSNAYTFPTTAGTANQVMSMPASGTQLVWATAGSGGSSNWTVSGSEIYPTVATEVGIGTTTPNSNLHIRTGGGGTIPGLTVESTTTTEYGLVRVQNDQGKSIRFLAIGSAFTTSGGFKQNAGVLDADNPGGLSIVSRDAAGVIEFYSGGVAAGNLRMQIDANGLIGIGTTSQNRLLHVSKSSNGIEGIQVSNVNAGGSAYGILQFENDEAALSGAIIMNSIANTGYSGAGSMSIGTFGARSLGFFTNNSLAVLINSSKAVAFNSDFGTSGQVLTSAGTGGPPTWTTISVTPTLQNVLDNGSTLTSDETISVGTNTLTVSGGPAGSDAVLTVSNTNSSAYNLFAYNATGGVGVYGSAPVGEGVVGLTTDGRGVRGTASGNGLGGYFEINHSSGNSGEAIISLTRSSSSTAANGIGGFIRFNIKTTDGNSFNSNDIQSMWTNATHASRTSALQFYGVNNASPGLLMTLSGNGRLVLETYDTHTTYDNDTLAGAGGLAQNTIYHTSTGVLMIKL